MNRIWKRLSSSGQRLALREHYMCYAERPPAYAPSVQDKDLGGKSLSMSLCFIRLPVDAAWLQSGRQQRYDVHECRRLQMRWVSRGARSAWGADRGLAVCSQRDAARRVRDVPSRPAL